MGDLRTMAFELMRERGYGLHALTARSVTDTSPWTSLGARRFFEHGHTALTWRPQALGEGRRDDSSSGDGIAASCSQRSRVRAALSRV